MPPSKEQTRLQIGHVLSIDIVGYSKLLVNVPLCILSALAGVLLRGMDNNIFTQIGFVVLVGLACKNAILIVEFARQIQIPARMR